MYFATPSSGAVINEMRTGRLGFIDTPLQGNKRPADVVWCADNGCFNDAKFDLDVWLRFLEKNARDAGRCVFATAPDVVGDAAATLERSKPWLAKIRALGFPAAYVAQDGIENTSVPWDEFDCLFIGGGQDNAFKLGPIARAYIAEAKQRGKWVHMGRVNSLKRYRYAEMHKCDSADGTYLAHGPDTNLPKVIRWVNVINNQLPLFEMGA